MSGSRQANNAVGINSEVISQLLPPGRALMGAEHTS